MPRNTDTTKLTITIRRDDIQDILSAVSLGLVDLDRLTDPHRHKQFGRSDRAVSRFIDAWNIAERTRTQEANR